MIRMPQQKFTPNNISFEPIATKCLTTEPIEPPTATAIVGSSSPLHIQKRVGELQESTHAL